MCIVAPHDPQQEGENVFKKRDHDEKKEKSRNAARERRAKEFQYFQELEDLLPYAEPPIGSQKGAVDKTSLIRLTVAYLKSRDVVQNGLNPTPMKEEVGVMPDEIDLLSCLDGFSLVLGSEGEVIFVSGNVQQYVGLSPGELLGQSLSDYIHPSDLKHLSSLTAPVDMGKDRRVEVTLRMKCTVTERGRMVNLNQASYKPLRISGVTRAVVPSDQTSLGSPMFLGTASTVGPDMSATPQLGVFGTRHSIDMRFTEMDTWLSQVAGYRCLLGESFYNLVHTADIRLVQTAFRNLREHGLCCTPPYRLLVRGGGYCWLQTRASCTQARRGSSRGQSIVCQHYQMSEVLDRGHILAFIQMDEKATSSSSTTTSSSTCTNVLPSDNNMELLKVVQELLEDKPTVIQEATPGKMVIIEPRTELTPPLSSLPIPVIVSPIKPVTRQLFGQNSTVNTTPKAVTAQMFGSIQPQTESLFSPVSQCSSQDPQTMVKDEEDLHERDFFSSLFKFQMADLEALSPYIGEDTVRLRNKSESSDVSLDEFLEDEVDQTITPPKANSTPEATDRLFGEEPVKDMPIIDGLFESLFSTNEIEELTNSFVEEPRLDVTGGGDYNLIFGKPLQRSYSISSEDNDEHEGVILHPELDIMWGSVDMELDGTCRSPDLIDDELDYTMDGGKPEVTKPPDTFLASTIQSGMKRTVSKSNMKSDITEGSMRKVFVVEQEQLDSSLPLRSDGIHCIHRSLITH